MFFTFNYYKLISIKKIKTCKKNRIFIYPFWIICDLMVNYMEIQDFVELLSISLLRYTWNDTESVLENCETILQKVLEFFFWKPVLTMLIQETTADESVRAIYNLIPKISRKISRPPHPLLIFSCDQAALWMVQSVRPSVCLSVRLSHLFHHVPIIVSSWNFQELLPWSKVMSMQKVKVRGQRSRSQRSTPNLAVSGL